MPLPTLPKKLTASGPLVGQPISRVDGRAKVTGTAKYAAEPSVSNLTFGVVLSSAIARGKITKVDAAAALSLPGVLHVFTHENRPSLPWFDRSYVDDDAPPGSPFRPLYSEEIFFSAQPIGLVVAETFELANYAASLVKFDYAASAHETDLAQSRGRARDPKAFSGGRKPPPKPRGDVDKALAQAVHRVEAEYHAASEHHHPMEMHASTVVYEEGGSLTIYDKTQGVQNSQSYVCQVFGYKPEQVSVQAQFVGGAFGSGLRPQYQLFLATMAARELKRSVRVTLTRQQMFTFGHRPETIHQFQVAASAEGKLEAVVHQVIAETSQFEDYVEVIVNWSGVLYQCPNTRLEHKVVSLDYNTPLDMRAPGAAWGVNAFECVIDELAEKVGLDPLEFRLLNYAETDQNEEKPFSSKELRACYAQGAAAFGWAGRPLAPRARREGHELVGWGMATGSWDAQQQISSARATLSIDGTLVVSAATADIGTGTYTIMTQLAADALGLAIDAVTFKLGDSSLPTSPLQGGSWTAATVGSAVKAVCDLIGERLWKIARQIPGSPVATAKLEEVTFTDGRLHVKGEPRHALAITEIMRAGKVLSIEEETTAAPNPARSKYAHYVHSAVFVEVRVDEVLGKVRVTRVVDAVAGGRILNPKTARSQIVGGVVWGIGMALEEETVTDHRLGRYMNHSLAEYHIPVHADVREIEVIFVEEHDPHTNPLGAKGLGEIGIVGTAAAIANAIYHATGKRVRELPIKLDKLL